MATLQSPKNVSPLYVEGNTPLPAVLFMLKNVTTGDTIDVSPWFQTVIGAVVLGIKGGAQIAASIAGTVITMPTGLAADGGYLTVLGTST